MAVRDAVMRVQADAGGLHVVLVIGSSPGALLPGLEEAGAGLRRVSNLDAAAEYAEQADVCLLGPDGPDTEACVACLGRRGPPVIRVVDADAPTDEVEAALAAGAFDVLRADAGPAEVRARAQAARRYRLQRGRARRLDARLAASDRERTEAVVRSRALEAEAARNREDARRHERLAAVGTFAAGIAHQINNPLTGVVGFGELLLCRDDLDPDVTSDVERMVTEAKRAARIIREMLDLTRSCTRSEPVDVNALLERTRRLPQLERTLAGISVETDFAEPPPCVRGDGFRLQQVFQNVVENAAHALDGLDAPRIVLRTTIEGRQVVCRIADNGPGVPSEQRARLFDAFFTTKRSESGRRGTGLGLPICRTIVREHDGEVTYEEAPDGGACFAVRLPLQR